MELGLNCERQSDRGSVIRDKSEKEMERGKKESEDFRVIMSSSREERDENIMIDGDCIFAKWDGGSQLSLPLYKHLITMKQTEEQTNGRKHVMFCRMMVVLRQGAGLPIFAPVTDRNWAD